MSQIEKAAEIANNDALENADIAEQSVEKTENSQNILKEMQENIVKIVEFLHSIASLIKEIKDILNTSHNESTEVNTSVLEAQEKSKEISNILRKIENVIIQTTMLSVSGSIEAARSGEFGKGFAVVSSDIRNLAQEAQSNLENIREIVTGFDKELENIIKNWNETLLAQHNENKEFEKLEKETNNLLNTFKTIDEVVAGLVNANNQNLEALNQTLQASEQIKQALDLSVSNVAQSKEAANLILHTVVEMGNLVEEIAVFADELQQG